MGLVDLRKASSSSSNTSSMMATANENRSNGGGNLVTLRNSGESNTVVLVGRKKRTFDIAFLTGQEEVEEKLNAAAKQSPPVSSSAKKGVVVNNAADPLTTSSSPSLSSAMNPTHDDSSNNSECSSIDVMTNGSLSESESSFAGALSRRLGGKNFEPSPPDPPAKVKPIRPDVFHVKLNNNNNNNNSNHVRNNNNHQLLSKAGKKTGGKSNYHHHHHHHLEGITSSSSFGRRHEDEIRFETRRTLDINQTSETVKIKENVHFSTTLGSSSISALTPAGLGGPADLLPFALLPQIAKFPGVHLSPFSAKLEKDGLNLLANYPAKINAAAATRHHLNQPSPHQFPPDHPYNHLNIHIAQGPYAHYGPPMPMHRDLNRSPNNRSNFPNNNNHHHHPHHHHHLNSGSPPGLHNNNSNSIGLSPPTNSNGSASTSSSSASPNSSLSAAAAVAAAAAAAATLLPPSLTALTLPAQNVCAKCNIGFRMTSDLVYHMRSHHKRDRDVDPMKKKREEKLKCPVCHETFRERHHLTRHMTAHQDRAEEFEEKILNVV